MTQRYLHSLVQCGQRCDHAWLCFRPLIAQSFTPMLKRPECFSEVAFIFLATPTAYDGLQGSPFAKELIVIPDSVDQNSPIICYENQLLPEFSRPDLAELWEQRRKDSSRIVWHRKFAEKCALVPAAFKNRSNPGLECDQVRLDLHFKNFENYYEVRAFQSSPIPFGGPNLEYSNQCAGQYRSDGPNGLNPPRSLAGCEAFSRISHHLKKRETHDHEHGQEDESYEVIIELFNDEFYFCHKKYSWETEIVA